MFVLVQVAILMSQMGLGCIPVFRELWLNPSPVIRRIITHSVALSFTTAIFGGFCFATQIPESLFPESGILDYVGSGHNIMHVMVSLLSLLLIGT